MKKQRILIIVGNGIKNVSQFYTRAAHDAGVAVDQINIRDLVFSIMNGKPDIYNTIHNRRLAEYDAVYCRDVWSYHSAAIAVQLLAEHLGIRVVNRSDATGPFFSKLSQMFRFALANLPVPNTIYIADREKLCHYLAQDRPFSYPFIVKSDNGIQGRDNFLIKKESEFADTVMKSNAAAFLAQEYIENEGDLRILYVGHEHPPLVFQRVNGGDSHLNNISSTGRGVLLDVNEISPDILRIAYEAAAITGREIAGVDIIPGKTKPYLLEVNETPALAGGFAGEQKVSMLAQFLRNL